MRRIWLCKGIFTLVVILALVTSSFVFAQENKKSEDQVLKLSLKDAVKLAEENNQQIKLSKLGLEKAELGRKQYRHQDKKLKDAVDLWEGLSPEEKKGLEQKMIEDMKKELGEEMGEEEGRKAFEMLQREMESFSSFEVSSTMDKSEKQAEVGVKLAKAGIDVTVKGVQFGVEAAYYGALLARDNTAIAQGALDRQKDMLRIAEAKYKVGTVAKTEVLDAQVQLAKAKADFLKARSEEEKACINLKKLLGLSQDRVLELTDSFDYEPTDLDTTLEELIKKAQKNRIDVMSDEGVFEIAKLDFDLNSKVYPSNTFIYKEKEYAMEETRIKLADTKSEVEAQVREIWLDFEEAKSNIPVMDKAVEMAQESLRLAKLSYEAGLVRSVDVAAAEEGLKQVQLQRSGVIYNYNLARLKLENAVYFSVSGGIAAGANGATSM